MRESIFQTFRLSKILWILLVLWINVSSASEIPKLQARVNDYANILSTDTVTLLESKLDQIERETSAQVAVLTVPSLNGSTIEEFSLQTFNAWGLGQKDLNNGVLLTVALKEKMLRIEVGTGLKSKISKLISTKMISDIIPYFKKGNTDTGVIKAVSSIDKAVKGKYRIIASNRKLNRIIKYNLFRSIAVYGLILALSYRVGQYLRAVTVSLLVGSIFGAWFFMKILTQNISLIEFMAKLYNTMIVLIIIGTPVIILLAIIIASLVFTKDKKNTPANTASSAKVFTNEFSRTTSDISTLTDKKPKDGLNTAFILLIIPTSLMLGMIIAMIVFYDVTPAIIISDIYNMIVNFLKAILVWLGIIFVFGIIGVTKEFFFPNSTAKEGAKANTTGFLGGGGRSDGEAGSSGWWGGSGDGGGDGD